MDDLREIGTRGTPTLDILLLLSKSKWQIVTATLVGAVAGLFLALLIKPTYTAEAIILPPQAPQSSISALMGQLGSITGLESASSLLKTPGDTYVGILQSRTIADHAIDKFHLLERWHLKKRVFARNAVAGHVQFELAKNGLIDIRVKDTDPQFASALANFFVDDLYGMNSHLAITEASQRRLFFDQRLKEEEDALSAAENDLKNTQLKTGLITLGSQTDLAVRNIAETRAQISSKEVQLQGMRTYESDENLGVRQLEGEIGTLRSQLAQLEDSERRSAPGNTEVAASQVPAGSLEYVRNLREVKYHETLYELLSRQAEAARIDEAKSAPLIQVIDRAVPPDTKSGPPRALITIGTAILSFCFSCLWVFTRGVLDRAKKTPELAHKLYLLQEEFHWR